ASKSSVSGEAEIAGLRQQIDELRKAQDSAMRELQRLSGENKAREAQSEFLVGEAKSTSGELGQMKAKLAETERAIVDLRGSIESLRNRADAAPSAPQASPPSSPSRATRSAAPDASPEQLFASAMSNLQADEYGQAVLEWTGLTHAYPEHPLAANAQYWIGETYYRQRDFQQALVEFRKVIDGYGSSPQVPEALLKIGLCYGALDDAS